ncbi:MAG TPA: M17 family peptidase N-terminal domain-containing protein [Candidatus Acidoferrum sp.]|jgi:hypothetical protein|nr:M17 family peptidase N-terminal domain-containing protein [Candidatus Acidoferrum sp.]
MKTLSIFRSFTFVPLSLLALAATTSVRVLTEHGLSREKTDQLTASQANGQAARAKPKELQVSNAPIPTRVLVQSPVETDTELQIICLFESSPENTLHGSLAEINEKLKGLLDKIRKPALFRGEFGETLMFAPPAGTLAVKRILIVGLGDSESFTSQRMELVGSIVYRESSRLGVAHPFFAPTILDGGVTKFGTGDVAERFYTGFLRGARTKKVLEDSGASPRAVIEDLTFLAGPTHAADTQQGIERALANPPN